MGDIKIMQEKVRTLFGQMSICKDTEMMGNIFAGRNLPAFVKDYILKQYVDSSGKADAVRITEFMNNVLPKESTEVKEKLNNGDEVVLLTRFNVEIDLVRGVRRFGIPDLGIRMSEGEIPASVYSAHEGELVDGEKWGLIKICLMQNEEGMYNHVEMLDYKPFKPYKRIDIGYYINARRGFGDVWEWIDFLLSAMGYDANGFENKSAKFEFITRLLIFVEPRLNVIELAPKGTGKSYVFGNMSKYGWLVSGGKVSRAKLFFDKLRQMPGILKNHDVTAFDEIQTIVFQEPSEIQAALKSYLESGKTTIDNYEFSSECGMILMGNIGLDENRTPISRIYFSELPKYFKESALLDRFHCFIEGWKLPRIHKGMIYNGWTVNAEYFSEILHTLRTENIYSQVFDKLVSYQSDADMRDFTAVKRIATGYMKLLYPHWRNTDDVDRKEFQDLCLTPAIKRRGTIKEQCNIIDPEFRKDMPEIKVKEI